MSRKQRNNLPNYDTQKWVLQLFEDENSLTLKKETAVDNRYRKFLLLLQKYIQNGCELTKENYRDIFTMMIQIEDSYIVKRVESCFLKKQKIIKVEEDKMYKCLLKNAIHISREIEERDILILHNSNLEKSIRCKVTNVNDTEIEFTSSKKDGIDLKQFYDIEFEKDRTSTEFELHAVDFVKDRNIKTLLFPDISFIRKDSSLEYTEFDWFSKFLNNEQKQTVINIVNNISFPVPYILFGPPGTGKTITLVEAIAQIRKLKPDARIMVTAHSNTACDEVALRLLKLDCIPEEDILRYYSKSRLVEADEIDAELCRISNAGKGFDKRTEGHKILKYKIIICTLVMSGRIALKGLKKLSFDYMFIDEAGSATEPSAIIPLQAFISRTRMPMIVLSGDPKQLGPIITCKQAEMLGLGKSLLERLMNLDMYKPDPVTGKYNTTVLTHLIQNFRSHPEILHVSNTLFYDGKLVASAVSRNTNMAIGWNKLPNRSVPIILRAIKGKTENDDLSFSLYNKEELYEVLQYVKIILKNGIQGRKIVPKEIGIISPYKKQCDMIKKYLWYIDKSDDIEVDTVERFQGQEREVIIVSTVRSKTSHVGFLDNPKRLNVTLTRAKSLLIVIGNPDTLKRDKNWSVFVQFCKKRSAYCEKPIPDNTGKLLSKLKSNHYRDEAIHDRKEELKRVKESKRFSIPKTTIIERTKVLPIKEEQTKNKIQTKKESVTKETIILESNLVLEKQIEEISFAFEFAEFNFQN